jgi:ribonuclease HII
MTIIGLDEVGLGALAGPLVVVATAFEGWWCPQQLNAVNDSKKLTPKKREGLAPLIVEAASFLGIGWSDAEDIDRRGVTRAWQDACVMALQGAPDDDNCELLVDGDKQTWGYYGKQQSVVKGDSKHWQIGAASIVAKVLRDAEMAHLGDFYPEYLWAKNKGYGTKDHNEAIKAVGACPFHRELYLRKLRAA